MIGTQLDEEVRDALENLPPSAKLVCFVLVHEQPLTQSGLVDETMLSSRTVRYAVKELEAAGIVTSEIYIPDARKNVYRLRRSISID